MSGIPRHARFHYPPQASSSSAQLKHQDEDPCAQPSSVRHQNVSTKVFWTAKNKNNHELGAAAGTDWSGQGPRGWAIRFCPFAGQAASPPGSRAKTALGSCTTNLQAAGCRAVMTYLRSLPRIVLQTIWRGDSRPQTTATQHNQQGFASFSLTNMYRRMLQVSSFFAFSKSFS